MGEKLNPKHPPPLRPFRSNDCTWSQKTNISMGTYTLLSYDLPPHKINEVASSL